MVWFTLIPQRRINEFTHACNKLNIVPTRQTNTQPQLSPATALQAYRRQSSLQRHATADTTPHSNRPHVGNEREPPSQQEATRPNRLKEAIYGRSEMTCPII